MPNPLEEQIKRLFKFVGEDEEDAVEAFRAARKAALGGDRADMIEPLRMMNLFHQSSSQYYFEDNERAQVSIDVPGVAKEDLKVQVTSPSDASANHLVPACVVDIAGVRRGGGGGQGKDLQVTERIRFGPSVQCEKLSAILAQGVLTLSAPKVAPQKQEVTTRTLDVKGEE